MTRITYPLTVFGLAVLQVLSLVQMWSSVVNASTWSGFDQSTVILRTTIVAVVLATIALAVTVLSLHCGRTELLRAQAVTSMMASGVATLMSFNSYLDAGLPMPATALVLLGTSLALDAGFYFVSPPIHQVKDL